MWSSGYEVGPEVGMVKMFNPRAGSGSLTVSGYPGDVIFSVEPQMVGTRPVSRLGANDPGIMPNSMVSFTPLNAEGRLLATNAPQPKRLKRPLTFEVLPIMNAHPAPVPSSTPGLPKHTLYHIQNAYVYI